MELGETVRHLELEGPGQPDILGSGMPKHEFVDTVEERFEDQNSQIIIEAFSANEKDLRAHGSYGLELLLIEMSRD